MARGIRVRRAAERLRRLAPTPEQDRERPVPVLSVVIPVYNVEAFLPMCLDSVLGQTLTSLEVIAVDDGSTDGSAAVLDEYAARDPRLVVVRQENAGQGIARNRGTDLAQGEFLTFCDADDVVPRAAYAAMVAVLERSGSDFCVGGARRFSHSRMFPVSWGRSVHQRDRIGTTIDEFPAAMQDIIAANRLFRTRFWREQVPPFRGHRAYEDHVPMLAAYVRARRFDVLSRTTYHWRIREDNTSTGQQKARLENLLDRISAKEEARDLLLAEASTRTYDAWVARTLDIDFQPFLEPALSAGDMYRNVLGAACRTMFDRASAEALGMVRFNAKVRAWLAATGQWRALVEADEHFRAEGRLPPAVVVDGRIVAREDGVGLPDLVPHRLRELSVHETELWAAVRDVRPDADGNVEIVGFAAIRGLDESTPPAGLAAWLEGPDGERRTVSVVPADEPSADLTVTDPQADHRGAGFRVAVDPRTLAALTPGTRWNLVLRVERDGVLREGGLHEAVPYSPAQDLRAIDVDADGRSLRVLVDLAADGLCLEVEQPAEDAGGPGEPADPARPRVREVRLTPEHLVVVLEPGPAPEALAAASLTSDVQALSLDRVGAEHGAPVLEFRRTLSRWGSLVAPALGAWTLRLPGPDGRLLGADPAESLRAALPCSVVEEGALRVNLRVRREGRLGLLVSAPVAVPDATARGRRELRQRYRAASAPVQDAVLLSASGARPPGPDLRALERELAQRHPALPRWWAVRSLADPVPDGARPLIVGTRAWYDALSTSRYVLADDDLPPFFRKRAGQRVLQVFSGRPAKTMGVARWRELGWSQERIGFELDRVRAQWDLLLAADARAEALYRAQLRWDGPVLTVGSPRDDLLLAADRDPDLRARTRAALAADLGIDPERRLVLYAPTFRDALSPRVPTAGLPPDGVDLAALGAALGEETTLLFRAHPLDRRQGARLARRAGVADVTDHPDVMSLLLAADAAVLDYSALRFDWALTGRPAAYLVPDQARYFAVRGSLEEYRDTVAGPLVETPAGVAEALRDPAAWTARHGEELARLRARFHAAEDGRAAARVLSELVGD